MKVALSFLIGCIVACNAYGADILNLDSALRNTYRACVDIDDNLHDLKVLAGINTAVTAIGSGVGIGAVATGVAKANWDKRIDDLFSTYTDIAYEYQGDDPTDSEISQWLDALNAYMDSVDWDNLPTPDVEEVSQIQQQIQQMKVEAEHKSKKLGNWRTGLLATNTATNIAGAVIASRTVKQDDIPEQIQACINATAELSRAIASAKMNGVDTTEASQIYSACSEYEYVDVSPIKTQGKSAMVAASIGAGLGGVGTLTSGLANGDKVRNNNNAAGKNKEQGLNTASNALSFGATMASVTATVFNAKQISAIKKLAAVSEKCTGVLR